MSLRESKILKGYTLAILSAASYGLIPLFVLPVKRIDFPLNTTLFYRFFIAALITFFILIFKRKKLGIKTRELGILAMLGLLYGLSSDFLFQGYDFLGAGVASTIFFVYPVLVALIMSLAFREKWTGTTMITLIICFTGVYLLSLNGSGLKIEFRGLLITLFSALAYGLYLIVVRKGNLKLNGWKLTFYSMLFTSFYYLTKVGWLNQSLSLPDFKTFFNFFLFALVTTVLSLAALVYAVKYIGPTPTAILGVFEPLVAVIISIVFFNEPLTLHLIFGGILIIFGVAYNIYAGSKRKVGPTG